MVLGTFHIVEKLLPNVATKVFSLRWVSQMRLTTVVILLQSDSESDYVPEDENISDEISDEELFFNDDELSGQIMTYSNLQGVKVFKHKFEQ